MLLSHGPTCPAALLGRATARGAGLRRRLGMGGAGGEGGSCKGRDGGDPDAGAAAQAWRPPKSGPRQALDGG